MILWVCGVTSLDKVCGARITITAMHLKPAIVIFDNPRMFRHSDTLARLKLGSLNTIFLLRYIKYICRRTKRPSLLAENAAAKSNSTDRCGFATEGCHKTSRLDLAFLESARSDHLKSLVVV